MGRIRPMLSLDEIHPEEDLECLNLSKNLKKLLECPIGMGLSLLFIPGEDLEGEGEGPVEGDIGAIETIVETVEILDL